MFGLTTWVEDGLQFRSLPYSPLACHLYVPVLMDVPILPAHTRRANLGQVIVSIQLGQHVFGRPLVPRAVFTLVLVQRLAHLIEENLGHTQVLGQSRHEEHWVRQ